MPYLKEELKGEGSFGRVYKVLIAKNIITIRMASLSTTSLTGWTRKDYSLNDKTNAFEKEREVMREILSNSKSHNNIIKSKGSIQVGLKYSLFMPLAECDL
jgi:serine/threonine protein kinase